MSNKPKERLELFQVGSPIKLKIICIIEGTSKTEKKLHEDFKKYRIYGEWFKPELELLEYIKTVKKKKI